MATTTDIQQVDSLTQEKNVAIANEKDVIQASGSDIEGDGLSDREKDIDESKKLLADKIERVELTPVEAFDWDVSGDQSPFPEVAACKDISLTTITPSSRENPRNAIKMNILTLEHRRRQY